MLKVREGGGIERKGIQNRNLTENEPCHSAEESRISRGQKGMSSERGEGLEKPLLSPVNGEGGKG